MNHNYLLTLLFLFATFCLQAQTNLSGIINAYATVTDIEDCENELILSQTTGFEENMEVILIQMQGATINTNNASSFGDITQLGSAGLYERNRIQAINGNVITLANALVYDYDVNGSVQLVSLPVYDNAVVTDTLTAEAWDGSVGGILALEITGELQFNEVIDLSGKGFRGGTEDIMATNNCSFLTNANNYYYEENNWRAALKGEGIAIVTTDRESGRGPQATGGGGGNDHNAGGGGGAQLTNGGQGGRNEEPSTFGCEGNFPGLGGKTPEQFFDRVFLGGGGGAGHENNNEGTPGGNGGGILILIANSINGNDQSVFANGITPEEARGDGGSGGGAGGTLVIDAQNITNDLNLVARGGDGGICNNINFDRCMGPGGGGSGGRIIIDQTLPFNSDLSGGTEGLSINSEDAGCPDGPNGATPGVDGVIESFESIPEGEEPNTAPTITTQPEAMAGCTDSPITFTATVAGFGVTLQWQVDMGNGFEDIEEQTPYNGTNSPTLTIDPVSPDMDGYVYRLIVTTDCFNDVISDEVALSLDVAPMSNFTFDIFGLAVQFNNTSTNANTYQWFFGDGESSNDSDPGYGYSSDGTYEVTLIANNGCGADTLTQTIVLSNLPLAAFTATPTSGCVPLIVTFDSFDSENADTYEWQFPGGMPATSTAPNPTVTYETAGLYDVTLIASNDSGADTLALTNYIEITEGATGNFTYDVNGLTVNFMADQQFANEILWDFGDLNTSTLEDPTHTYEEPGVYEVTLTLTNDCGFYEISEIIDLSELPLAAFSADPTEGCAPLSVTFTNESTGGATDLVWLFPGGTPNFSNLENPVINYTTPGNYDVTLIASNTSGFDTLTIPLLVDVTPPPVADAFGTASGLTVTFTNLTNDGATFFWDFGDTNTSDQFEPVHTYSQAGVYDVTLIVTNDCGSSTLIFQVFVGSPPMADFTFSQPSGCIPHTVSFTETSSGEYTSIFWEFEGGDPATTTSPNPVVTYDAPGTYDVTLTISGALGANTLVQNNIIEIQVTPIADFSFETDQFTVQFTNESTDATSYFWDFGDGNFSTEENPVHTYDVAGVYEVTLNAQNSFCGNAFNRTVPIMTTGTEDTDALAIRLYPNPVRDLLYLEVEGELVEPFDIQVFNSAGALVKTKMINQQGVIDMSDLPSGLYLLKMQIGGRVKTFKLAVDSR